MVGWHHRLNGHEFEQAPGVGDGQGSLACYIVHGVANSRTWLCDWTELNCKRDEHALKSIKCNTQSIVKNCNRVWPFVLMFSGWWLLSVTLPLPPGLITRKVDQKAQVLLLWSWQDAQTSNPDPAPPPTSRSPVSFPCSSRPVVNQLGNPVLLFPQKPRDMSNKPFLLSRCAYGIISLDIWTSFCVRVHTILQSGHNKNNFPEIFTWNPPSPLCTVHQHQLIFCKVGLSPAARVEQ